MTIQVKNISKTYGNRQVVKNISLTIEPGKILGLLGPNGAGKSTTIKILTGQIKPSSGEIHIDNNKYNYLPEEYRNRLGIMPQEIVIWDDLSIAENLKMSADIYNLSNTQKKQRSEFLIESLKLQPELKTLARNLSGGYKRRLNLAISIIHDPEVIFLDEPTPGIDAQSRHLLMNFIAELADTGKYSIVLTDHYLDEAEKLCDYFIIIDNGEIVTEGNLSQLKRIHGAGNFLTIDLSEDDGSEVNTGVVDGLLKIFPEGQFVKGNFVSLANDISKSLDNALKYLNKENVKFQNISVKEPSLEDIFLLITGKDVRE